jgi:hypothetical protein
MSFRITSALIATLLLSNFSWADRPLDIETAAKAFRIRVYNSFRQNRDEYNTRIAAGEEVLSAWTRGGTEAEEQAVLMWFLAASEASNQGAEQSLPELAVMETLNKRRTTAFKARQAKNKQKSVKQTARGARPQQVIRSTPASAKKSGAAGLAGMFGQMVNQGVDRILNKGNQAGTTFSSRARSSETPFAETPTSETASTTTDPSGMGSATTNSLESSELVPTSEAALLALQPAAETPAAPNPAFSLQQINETITGHNLAIGDFKERLASEWDFDPESADELVTSLEGMAANELNITNQVAALSHKSHGQIVPIESVNSLLGEVIERLEALNEGRDAFAEAGFAANDVEALFNRVEKIRSDLEF